MRTLCASGLRRCIADVESSLHGPRRSEPLLIRCCLRQPDGVLHTGRPAHAHRPAFAPQPLNRSQHDKGRGRPVQSPTGGAGSGKDGKGIGGVRGRPPITPALERHFAALTCGETMI
jgi:hypothetical protein